MARRRITSPTLEFASEGVPRWIHVRGTQQQIQMQFTSLTDISSYTFETQIEEVDTNPGVEPVDGTPKTDNGETRELIPVSVAGNTAIFAIPKELGTPVGNDGSTAVTGPSAVPQPGLPVYYYVSIRLTDSGVGDNQQSWSVFGQIALQYSVIDQ